MRRAQGAVAIVVGVAMVLSMTGCSCVAQQVSKQAIENSTGVKVDQSTGKTTITGKNGSATLSSGQNKLPDGLPDYVPTYSGTVKSSTSISTDKGTNYTFLIVTADSPQTAADWYKQQFAAKGWTVTATVLNGDQGMISAKRDDTDNTVVTLGKSSDGQTEINTIVDVKK